MTKPDKNKPMTVKQAIEWLGKLKDKDMFLMVDCPHCGRGQQLSAIEEVVLLRGVEVVDE